MTATAANPTTYERSDFRTVTLGGAKFGAFTAAGVLLFAILSKLLPAGGAGGAVLALLVLAIGAGAALLPAAWVGPQSGEGLAAAAGLGLCGTITFTAIDVAVLRPLNQVMTIYPWTWDAIGGGSKWWYIPIWWMLGTLLAWTGALHVAGQATAGRPAIGRAAGPLLLAAIVLGAVARLAVPGLALPVAAGAGLVVALVVLALVSVVRRR